MDKREGISYFIKAAKMGLAEAQSILGACYLYGEGVDKNVDEAIKWLRQAARGGDKEAKLLLNNLELTW